MEKDKLYKLKYPIGDFIMPVSPTREQIDEQISILQEFPSRLENLVNGLSIEQVQWKYRPDGWAIKHVVHHCADSHMNSIIRFKLGLTEDVPTVKPYEEGDWALLKDSQSDNLTASLDILNGVHKRLDTLLSDMTDADFKKVFFHPGMNKQVTLAQNTALYAWHAQHHYAHVEQALKNKGSF